MLYLYTLESGNAQQYCGLLLFQCSTTVAPCPYSAVTACWQSLFVVMGEQPLAAQPAPLVIADHSDGGRGDGGGGGGYGTTFGAVQPPVSPV